jgi:hypothetical protein
VTGRGAACGVSRYVYRFDTAQLQICSQDLSALTYTLKAYARRQRLDSAPVVALDAAVSELLREGFCNWVCNWDFKLDQFEIDIVHVRVWNVDVKVGTRKRSSSCGRFIILGS